jgi:phosphohistidine swiveling domain-containing protein
MPNVKAADNDRHVYVVTLGEDRSTELAVAGGKGASLSKLIKAGFPVPSGFVVTTGAYSEFLRANALQDQIEESLEGLDYGNLDRLERQTARIREAITSGDLSDSLTAEIERAYRGLGDGVYVAVRSSGTAEDLAGASFAGQYETYLDVRGVDELLDAVRRCWASMWTARVVAYRHNKGFDHADIGIAVVVQTMVEAEAAGVMFVGNPMNARADEIVINASWGLGEMVVSGAVTPDEYVVGRDTMEMKRRTLGSKELRVVRDPKPGKGTVQEAVPAKLREKYVLSNEQAATLADLGRRVTAHYDGLPQDTEWALRDGSFFLLQSRPITGVDFAWEEDLDLWPSIPEKDELIWTRAWADEVWTGPITPLMWSIRGRWMRDGGTANFRAFEMGDLADLRLYKYSRGTVYYNTRADELIAKYSLPPSLREPLLNRLHPSQLEDAINAPFDLGRTLKIFLTIEQTHPTMGVGGFYALLPPTREAFRARRRDRVETAEFLDEAQLRALGDDELKERILLYNNTFTIGVAAGSWSFIFILAPVIRALLKGVFQYWYTGDNSNAFVEVLSGLPWRTEQFYDDYEMWKLADTIRRSEKLRALMEEFKGAAFFEELKNLEEGRAFLEQYKKFLELNFYRGHADRDIYFARRIEDTGLDYEALRLLSTADDRVSPEEREEKLNQRREAATAEVIENLAKQPLGDLKVPVFKFLLDFSMRFFSVRDDSRPVSDVTTFQKKLPVRELGRRTMDRGLLEGERDFYFLSLDELCDLLAGKEPVPLARAKVAARKKAFDRFMTHEEDPPPFLKGNVPLDSGAATTSDARGDALKGVGTSPGLVTGRARIIPTQKEIGRLEKGDILVCHGTDPGWTSAFSIVSAVVAQTGGMLAHFSCLSREYGLPAVSLPNAMKLIKDGSIISVNGDSGEVRLASE